MADKYVNATGLRAVIDWVLSKFTKKEDFEGLEIGGRNLLLKTDILKYGGEAYSKNGSASISIDNETTYLGKPTIKIDQSSDTSGIAYYSFVKLEPNQVYTTSLMVKSSVDFDSISGLPMHMWISTTQTAGHLEIIQYYTKNVKKDVWTKMFVTFKTPNDAEQYYLRPFFYNAPKGIYNICQWKTELGNKATDWSPAPEDVETAISDVTNDCIKGLSVSDKTITYTKGDGSKGTITTQDTNTWRGIQNNLTSDSTTESLAAAQGKALKALVDGKAASSHKHAKSDITDMPTSLPANGGNADTATSATKATQDESGNNIKSSYASSISISDHTITLKNKNGTSLGTVTVPDNNTWRPLGTGANDACAGNDSRLSNARAANGSGYVSELVGVQSNNTPYSYTEGNIIRAVWDTKSDHRWYLKAGDYGCRVSYADNAGNASTATKLATARTIALTGSVTGSGTFDGSGDLSIATTTNHTHSYLPLSGGTMTGNIKWTTTNSKIPYIGYCTESSEDGTFVMSTTGTTYTTGLAIGGSSGNLLYKGNIVLDASNYKSYCTPANIGAAASSHTHNYAGSSSAGGSATSAVKLDSSAGSATQPVYFSEGKPVACSYTLEKSVPSNAVFTDTNTWRGIQNNLTSDSTTESLAAAQGKALKALVDGKAASSHTHAKSDITDMPTSLPANGGNADTVDGKHASDIFKHIGLKDASEVSPNERGCFSVNLVGESLGWINVVQFEQGHFISQLGFEINSYYNTGTVWTRSRYANNSFADWNSGWHRLGIDVVIGTSMGTIAYKSDYSKALIEFWKTTVGSASRTVYDSAIITGLSSSMTAVNEQIVSNGADFAFTYSISAGGAITPSGDFTKYKITYFN